MAFDFVAAFVEAGVESIEAEKKRGFAGFAVFAVAGDEGVVGWIFLEDCFTVEAFVNFLEFLIDDGEQVLRTHTDNTDVDFALVVVFDDFGAGNAFGEDDAGFPDGGIGGIGDVFDVAMHFDDEAGENAFGHEVFVFVTQDERVVGDRWVGGGVDREEMGGDVLAGAAGDFVADVECFHELQEFMAHVGVLGVGPNVFEVGVAELAQIGFDGGVVEDFVDGGGAPVGCEDEAVLEDGVFLEVEEDAEFVEESAQVEHVVAIGNFMAAADGFVFGLVDVVAAVVFEGVADGEPFVGEGDALGDEAFEFLLEGGFEFGEAAIVVEVGAVGIAEVGEFASEVVGVEGTGAIGFFVLDQVDGAIFAEELDALEPEVVVGVFASIVGNEEVAGAFGEEELVGLVVDFLAAEVPDVDAVGFAVGAGEFPVEDVDALG